MAIIRVPKGYLRAEDESPEEVAKREEIRRRLLRGEETVVTNDGELVPAKSAQAGDGIKTPPGKLA